MDSDDEIEAIRNLQLNQKHKPKKKKKKTITGFEEYYADAPTTPEEALKEQQELYSSTVPFEQRIQTCIHRYRSHRRFDNEVALYFDEYAFLGGIDTSGSRFTEQGREDTSLLPQPYTSQDHHDLSSSSPSSSAVPSSRYYDGNTSHWTVDFSSVVAGFLSISLVFLTGLEPAPTEKAISTVENFLRYVLQHDVCPEHEADVRNALRVCQQAREEWPRTHRLKSMLPGLFQLAAAQTFGVHEEADWSLQRCTPSAAFTPEVVFYASLVAAGQPVPPKDVRVARRFTASLALHSVEMPGEVTVDCFRRLALASSSSSPAAAVEEEEEKEKEKGYTLLGLRPLGRATFRPAVIEDGWVRQKTPAPIGEEEDVVFCFERDILDEMTLGMKVTACVAELSTGFRFVKKFDVVQPSFYAFLPQHLMRGFRPPAVNDRPPRSIRDAARATSMQEGGQQEQEEE